jgi:hypothetical protein
VAAGAVAVTASIGGVASAQTTEAESSAPAHEEPFVVWVKDPKAGELAVLVGTQELVYTDKKLAKKLAQAAARAHRA